MASESTTASYRYQELLASLTRDLPDERLKKKLSEVLALLDFNSTLNRTLALEEILDLILFVSVGETRASWAGILLRDGDDHLVPRARRGRKDEDWAGLTLALPDETPALALATDEDRSAWARRVLTKTKASLLAPLVKSDRLAGVLLLGEREAPTVPMREYSRKSSRSQPRHRSTTDASTRSFASSINGCPSRSISSTPSSISRESSIVVPARRGFTRYF